MSYPITWQVFQRTLVLFYYLCLLIVLAVSVHDTYLIVINRRTIAEDERNPVGRWLIELDSGDIRYIVIAKLLGTILVATVLHLLYVEKRTWAWIACGTLTTGQVCLAFYLST